VRYFGGMPDIWAIEPSGVMEEGFISTEEEFDSGVSIVKMFAMIDFSGIGCGGSVFKGKGTQHRTKGKGRGC